MEALTTFNSPHLEKLAALLASGHGVGFIGAGTSMACRYPGWSQYLGELFDRVRARVGAESPLLSEIGPEVDARIRVDRMIPLLPGFDAAFRERFQPPAGGHSIAEWIPRLFDLKLGLFLTTNYTSELESAAAEHPRASLGETVRFVCWHQPTKLDDALRGVGALQPIVYLHGRYDDSPKLRENEAGGEWSRVVLGLKSYNYAYLNPGPLAQKLRALGQARPVLLFVGASFADEDVTHELRVLEALRGPGGTPHYALLPLLPGQEPARRAADLREPFNVQPVFYSVATDARGQQDHSGIGALLEELAGRIARLKPVSVPTAPPVAAANLDDYRRWAKTRFGGIDLIGVGRGALALSLDEVYVPLRLSARPDALAFEGEGRSLGEFARAHAQGDVTVDGLFAQPALAGRHLVVFGDPGSGKTTFLQKLCHQCLGAGPESLGLPLGTVPVFVRLRRWSAELAARPFEQFLQSEIESELGKAAKEAEHSIPTDLGRRLWSSPSLLLLVDGLDEIADTKQRAAFCRHLEELVGKAEPASRVRAVVSSRLSGYGGSGELEVRFDTTFAPLDVHPLTQELVERFIDAWFRAAGRSDSAVTQVEAQAKARRLKAILASHGAGNQRLQVLAGTPLLLSLMCVVVFDGREIPRRRVEFYERCLEVLLRRRAPDEEDPPLDLATARAILEPLAHEMHAEGRSAEMELFKFAVHADGPLASGEKVSFAEALTWLHEQAGIFDDLGGGRYCFAHLGLQEYLAAAYVAGHGSEPIGALAEHLAEEGWQDEQGKGRWREVALLLVGLADPKSLDAFLSLLLAHRVHLEAPRLLEDCLRDARANPCGVLLARLKSSDDPGELRALLGLLRGRREPEVVGMARELARADDAALAALAERVLLESGAERAGEGLLILCSPGLESERARWRRALRVRGLTVAGDGDAWRSAGPDLLREARGALLLHRGDEPAWSDRKALAALRLLRRRHRPVLGVLLDAGAVAPAFPPGLEGCAWIEGSPLEGALDRIEAAFVEQPQPARRESASEAIPASHAIRTVELAGIRLVHVPGGRFRIGPAEQWDDRKRKFITGGPSPELELSPFWIGETAVTNEQYAVFLRETKHPEPPMWRNERFSDPRQPVVAVSWKDAQAFCAWLPKRTGEEWTLPSEAQWEFAARGVDRRRYPWGDEPEPDERLACFGQDWQKGRPARVGAYPAGIGPFGALDQAGGVWEWCRDRWSEAPYAEWQSGIRKDPSQDAGDAPTCVLRGGCWASHAERLACAVRDWPFTTDRDELFGFRVALARASR